MAGVKQVQESIFCVIMSESWSRSQLKKRSGVRLGVQKIKNMHTSGPEPQYKNKKQTVAYFYSELSSS